MIRKLSLLCFIVLFYSCSQENNQRRIDSTNEDLDMILDSTVSEDKYLEISKTLSGYLSHSGMSENEKREFVLSYCDSNLCLQRVFFKYPTKIDDFVVEGIFGIAPDGSIDYQSYGSLDAILFFSSDSLTFSILHPVFRPFTDEITRSFKPLECVELSYEHPSFPNTQRISLTSIRNLPFAFIDVDFDGKKELLLETPGNGQKTISTYSAYSLPLLNEINPFEEYTWNCLDEWTEFDYKTKTVISSLWGGYDGSEKWYFKYEGERLKPYLKEEYTHWFDSIKSSVLIRNIEML